MTANAESGSIRVDSARAISPDGADLVQNGSFEQYEAARQLTNTSLVMPTHQAMLGVAWQAPLLAWSIEDHTGAQLKSGEVSPAGGISVLPLGDLSQGFYSATIADPAGTAEPISTTFMVLDKDLTKRDSVDDRFGVMIHVDRDYYSQSGAIAAQLGFGTVRTDVRWAHVETTQGQYDFPENLNSGIHDLESNRLDVLPVSAFRNPFYDNNRVPSSDEALAAYASYTDALIAQYGVNAVEIFNEFNNPPVNNSACGPTPECYMQLLRANANRVHESHPGTLVVGPANAHKDDAFLTSLYQQGALDYLDVVSFHPYDYDYGDNKGAEFLVESLNQAHDRIKEYNNGESKPIWLTELGWSSTLVKTDELQADYLVRAQAISLGNGVERFYWYDLVNDHLNFLDHEGNFGLVRRASDTVPTFQPKLAAMAQAILVSKIGGKTYSAQDELNAVSYSYAFGSGESTTRVAWATSPTTVSFAAKSAVTLTDQYGAVSQLEPVKGKITVTLDGQTVYLDGTLGPAEVVE
ncbi:glycosyl hydrolase [Microterricola pindariensis]|uniref:glycosyl hydrolase n=1 Tax=Microterricola pindariensis TaxID=478010 RepID=UPI001E5BDD2C|nr:glycosyl hydrolase [Microterricola pindariensis]